MIVLKNTCKIGASVIAKLDNNTIMRINSYEDKIMLKKEKIAEESLSMNDFLSQAAHFLGSRSLKAKL